jgi:hypothetical protein
VITPASPSGYYDLAVNGNNFTAKSFGLTTNVLISGQFWIDTDNDRRKDSNETALGRWRVFIDTNRNGILDAGEVSTTTDRDGKYTLATLPAGTYRWRVVEPGGYTRLDPRSGYYDLALSAGVTATGRNFRYRKP